MNLQLLKGCRDYILLDRESFQESVSVGDDIPDPEDAATLAEIDDLLDRLDAAIGKQEAH